MKTKKNLVKTMLMSILTAGISSFGFTACSDDLNELDNNHGDAIAVGSNMMNLEQYSYTVPLEVQTDGAWKIDINFQNDDHHFCYALPSEGVGRQTVKLCVLDNWTDERNAAELCISDLQHPENNKTIHLGQKCNLDNPSLTRASGVADGDIPKGDIIWGVGYGYNICRQPGRGAVMHCPIIAIEKLAAAGSNYGRYTAGVTADFKITTHAGNTIDEIARKMESSSTLKGSFGGFKAEVGASFTHEDVSRTENTFALGTVDVALTQAYLGGIQKNNVRNYMTDDAKRVIDGNGSIDTKNFQDVINSYGTHLLVKAPLGGRLRYATTIDKKHVQSENDLKMWANANYKNKFIESDTQVSVEQKKSHQMTDEKGSVRVSAEGGSYDAVIAISGIGNDSTQYMQNWINSLDNESNLVVVGTNGKYDMEMMPIWELVDAKYPERQQKLRDYIESGMAEYDLNPESNIVKTGEMAMFTIPTFNNDARTTLVQEVYSKNKVVAQICNEYLPDINPSGRVTVVYPVVSGKPVYSNGLFIGNADYAPQYINWNNDGSITYTRIEGAKKGQLSTVYVRDNKLFTKEYHSGMVAESEVISTQVKGKYMEGTRRVYGSVIDPNSKKSKMAWTDAKYNYPLVKIATKLWTREDYAAEIKGDCHKKYDTNEDKNKPQITFITLCSYYTDLQAKNGNNIPAGWKVATSQDYQAVKNLLSTNSYATPAKRLFDDNLSGFNAIVRSWYSWDTHKEVDNDYGIWQTYKGVDEWTTNHEDGHMEYMTSDEHHICVKTDGTFDIVKWGNTVKKVMAVRLVAN